ncbi:hypothetical protein ABZT08_08600 [Streptomyces sp. NPDC005526]
MDPAVGRVVHTGTRHGVQPPSREESTSAARLLTAGPPAAGLQGTRNG